MIVEKLTEMLDSMIEQSYNDDFKVFFNDHFTVNRIYMDDGDDICLVSNEMDFHELNARSIRAAIEDIDDETGVLFVLYDDYNDGTYFKIKSKWEFNYDGNAVVETVKCS